MPPTWFDKSSSQGCFRVRVQASPLLCCYKLRLRLPMRHWALLSLSLHVCHQQSLILTSHSLCGFTGSGWSWLNMLLQSCWTPIIVVIIGVNHIDISHFISKFLFVQLPANRTNTRLLVWDFTNLTINQYLMIYLYLPTFCVKVWQKPHLTTGERIIPRRRSLWPWDCGLTRGYGIKGPEGRRRGWTQCALTIWAL